MLSLYSLGYGSTRGYLQLRIGEPSDSGGTLGVVLSLPGYGSGNLKNPNPGITIASSTSQGSLPLGADDNKRSVLSRNLIL